MKRSIVCIISIMFIAAPAASNGSERQSLITEEFYVPRGDRQVYTSHTSWDNYNRSDKLLWHKLLLSLDVNSSAPENERYPSGNDCHYDTAVSILKSIREELGDDAPYQKVWVENQERVFTACDNKVEETPPQLPNGNSLPQRASTDYKYQTASWLFYKRDYEQALKIYTEVSEDKNAPTHGLAAYMVIRCLSQLGQTEQAYEKAMEVLSDKSLTNIHNITRNQRFILMWNKSENDQLAEKHLRWLLDTVKINPFSVVNMDQAIVDYFDALEQLDKYFPLIGESGSVDWWLDKNAEFGSPRMKAVCKLASELEVVDWMQASWALNVFDSDWLWSLFDVQNPYWSQNERIVGHAWERYKHGDGLEWLEIAIQRVHPDSPLAKDVLQEAEEYLTTEISAQQTNEYKVWVQNVWKHSIRVHLGLKQYDKAVALVTDKKFDYDSTHHGWYGQHATDSEYTIDKTIRYLTYVGEFNHARSLLTQTANRLPDYIRNHWVTLLALSEEEFLHFSLDEYTDSPPPLWMAMIDTFSADRLKALAEDKKLVTQREIRDKLSLAALTKAMLLQKPDIYDYAALAADKNILLKPNILQAVENKDSFEYVKFMLRTPRMRPIPFPRGLYGQGDALLPTQIDVYNHNDNNWWCRYSPAKISDDIWQIARVNLLSPNQITLGKRKEDEEIQKKYEENLRQLLQSHPYHHYTDTKEDKMLAEIPNAPQYLSEAVIERAKKKNVFGFLWGGNNSGNVFADDFYYAVRTTRYGCNRDGSHAAYSHEAFRILHKNFRDTIWAEKTPYWFD